MIRTVFALAALALLTAAAPEPAIRVEGAKLRPPPGGLATAAAYMTLRNSGDQPDRLVSAACDCARSVTLHASVTKGGVARMEQLTSVEVPAHGEAAFASTGRHLMLTGVNRPMKPGDSIDIVLTFERAGQVRTAFAVDPMAGMSGMHH